MPLSSVKSRSLGARVGAEVARREPTNRHLKCWHGFRERLTGTPRRRRPGIPRRHTTDPPKPRAHSRPRRPAGADEVTSDLVIAGAARWISSHRAAPADCAKLFNAAVSGELDTALPLYRGLHPLVRWDSRIEFARASNCRWTASAGTAATAVRLAARSRPSARRFMRAKAVQRPVG